MPKPISLKVILKTLRKKGFVFVSQKGSHAKFKKNNKPTRIVIIKMSKKEIPHGTFYQSILPQSGLNEKDFKNK